MCPLLDKGDTYRVDMSQKPIVCAESTADITILQTVDHDYKAFTLVENYAKIYPDYIRLYRFTKPQLRLRHGLDPVIDKHRSPRGQSMNHALMLESSLKRTKKVISDLVLCNDFEMFATFTFDPKKLKNRLDPEECKKVMSDWLANQRKIHGKFDYLIVPEFHKKGGLHFHALFKNYKGNIVDSGKKINGRISYNISSYKSGFSTMVKIDNIHKVSSYVKKYITKDMPEFANRKRYWCSKGLNRPVVEHNSQFADIPHVKKQILFANEGLQIINIPVKINNVIKAKAKGAIKWLIPEK